MPIEGEKTEEMKARAGCFGPSGDLERKGKTWDYNPSTATLDAVPLALLLLLIKRFAV
jgi:hypothetical protein